MGLKGWGKVGRGGPESLRSKHVKKNPFSKWVREEGEKG